MAKQLATLQKPLPVYPGLQRTLGAILLPLAQEGEDLCGAPEWKEGAQLLGWDETQLPCPGLYPSARLPEAGTATGCQTRRGTML